MVSLAFFAMFSVPNRLWESDFMRVLLNLGIALAAMRLIAGDPAAAETPPPRTGLYTQIEPAPDTEIELGFKTTRGIVLYFKSNREPNKKSHAQFYLCPTQDVQDVANCFELLTGDLSTSSYSALGVDNLMQTFKEADGKKAELTFDASRDEAKLICPAEKPEDLKKLTPEEIAYLNGRILSGDIRMMEIPDVAGDPSLHGINVFELKNGNILVIAHSGTHWGRAGNVRVRGYYGQSGAMQEIGVRYNTSEYSYVLDGVGVLQMRGRNNPLLNGEEVNWLDKSVVTPTVKNLGLDRILKHEPIKTLCGPLGPVS